MYVKLTIPERLKDLRVEQGLSLEQLAEETKLSKSALGKYETDGCKDISPFSVIKLAGFYGVSTDYLLGASENKNHPDTELQELHLSDDMIEVLKSGKLNNRLLCEMATHDGFERLMTDAEIYVDRIADMRINDLNAVLAAVRKEVIAQHNPGENDLYLRTLELAQIDEDGYFGHVVHSDMVAILRDIRAAHEMDRTTADTSSPAVDTQKRLQDAMCYEGSEDEKKARVFLATFGIDYDAITKEQFVNLMEVLKLSEHLKSPLNQRGKASPYPVHGKGKKKRK